MLLRGTKLSVLSTLVPPKILFFSLGKVGFIQSLARLCFVLCRDAQKHFALKVLCIALLNCFYLADAVIQSDLYGK